MTCIAGVAYGGTVWIGGDSAASSGGATVPYNNPKVFRRGQLLFGVVESFRMRDILHHELTIPRRPPGMSDDTWLVRNLIEEIRLTFVAAGFDLEAEDDEHDFDPGALLIGYHGRLFTMDWDYHLGEVKDGYHAIGSGSHFALGSLHTTRRQALTPKERVRLALEAADHHSQEVRPPFRILSVR